MVSVLALYSDISSSNPSKPTVQFRNNMGNFVGGGRLSEYYRKSLIGKAAMLRCEQDWNQCDKIGRFIGLWATFQSLRQQLFCPNLPHSQEFIVKVSKS